MTVSAYELLDALLIVTLYAELVLDTMTLE
jgi:hypothetical protein